METKEKKEHSINLIRRWIEARTIHVCVIDKLTWPFEVVKF